MRLTAWLIVGLVTLSACTAASTEAPSAAPAGSTTPSQASAAAGSATPASAEPSSEVCTPPELCGAELPPGRYASLSGTTTISFTVADDGWVGTQYDDIGFDLRRATDTGPPQLISGAPYDGTVFSDVCSGEQTEEIEPTAAAFLAFIAARPGIEVVAGPSETALGGRPALELELRAVDPGCTSEPPERLWLWMVGDLTDFHLNVGESARILAVDADGGGAIAFVVEAFSPADYEAPLPLAAPVLASIAFE